MSGCNSVPTGHELLKELLKPREGTASQMIETWKTAQRRPDAGRWHETMRRVRGEFEEMPCLRVALHQARMLFGLPAPVRRGCCSV